MLKELRFTRDSCSEGGVGVVIPLLLLPVCLEPSILLQASMMGIALLVLGLLFFAWLLVPKELRVRRTDRVFTRQWLLFPKRLAHFDEIQGLEARGHTLWAVRKDGNSLCLWEMKDPFLLRATAEVISSYTNIPLQASEGAPSGAAPTGLWYEQAPGAQRAPDPSHLDLHSPEGVTELQLGYGTFLRFDSGASTGRRLLGFGLMLASLGGIAAIQLGILHLVLSSSLKISDLWALAGLIALTGLFLWSYFNRPHWRCIPVDLLITAEGIQYAAPGEFRQLLHSQVSRVEAIHRRRHQENLVGSMVEILVPNVRKGLEGGTILIERLDRSTADYLTSRMHELARRAARTAVSKNC